MIEAKELRIGNWILPEHNLDGEYHKVTIIESYAINSYTEDWYRGIPLTHEILEKCGFKEDDNVASAFNDIKKYYSINGSFFMRELNGEFHRYIEVEDDPYYSFPLCQVKYLHQLQNLYFALTGKELEINL